MNKNDAYVVKIDYSTKVDILDISNMIFSTRHKKDGVIFFG